MNCNKILLLSSFLGVASYLAADCIPCTKPKVQSPYASKKASDARIQACIDRGFNCTGYEDTKVWGECKNGCVSCMCVSVDNSN